jgi:hypothetical protein
MKTIYNVNNSHCSEDGHDFKKLLCVWHQSFEGTCVFRNTEFEIEETK